MSLPKVTHIPETAFEATQLKNTLWQRGREFRQIVSIKNAASTKNNKKTVTADVYWCKPGGNVRSKPTSLTTFKRWLTNANEVLLNDCRCYAKATLSSEQQITKNAVTIACKNPRCDITASTTSNHPNNIARLVEKWNSLCPAPAIKANLF